MTYKFKLFILKLKCCLHNITLIFLHPSSLSEETNIMKHFILKMDLYGCYMVMWLSKRLLKPDITCYNWLLNPHVKYPLNTFSFSILICLIVDIRHLIFST